MLEKTRPGFDEPTAAWKEAASKLGAMWCGFMHGSPMWPIHGQYQCRTCGRRYPVQWVGELVPAREEFIAAGASQIHHAPSL
jgi:hypothetical protein